MTSVEWPSKRRLAKSYLTKWIKAIEEGGDVCKENQDFVDILKEEVNILSEPNIQVPPR